MIEISKVEDSLIAIALFFLVLYVFATLAETKPHWFRSKTFMKTRKMEDDYRKMVESRRELIHHYYWNKSENKKSQMNKIEKQILKMDKDLEQMRGQYEIVRKGLPVPLQMF